MLHLYLREQRYSFEQLPATPTLLIELLDLCHDASASFAQIALTIEKDPGLSAKIIQLANSTLFRQWNDVTEIRRMLVVLGMDNVRQIVIASAVHQYFAKFSQQFNQHVKQVWFRALICSYLSQRIAQLIGYQKPQEAYLAGLLYQVGQLLLLLNHQQSYPLLLENYEPTGDFCGRERTEFGSDHCELGAALAESWQLESFIADAILFQKAPTDELHSAPTLIKIIAVASFLSVASDTKIAPLALERAGILFNLTESSTLECLTTAKGKALQAVKETGFGNDFSVATEKSRPADGSPDEKIEQQLADRIRDLALANGQPTTAITGEIELVKNLRATFEILFQIKALFFIRTGSPDHLTIVNDLGLKQLDELSFDTTKSHSILSQALQSRQPQDSFSAIPAMMDQQLTRLLKTTGVHFIPLCHKDTVVAIIALGVSAEQHLELCKKANLLKLLCRDVSNNLLPNLARQTTKAGLSYEQLGRITHELSNPLTIIKNYLYLLGKKIGKEHAAYEEIAFIDEEIDRVANILLRAKDPTNVGLNNDSTLDLNKLLQDLDRLLGDSLFKTANVKTRLQLDQTIPPLACPRDKVKQILINILKNACEALTDGGAIDIVSKDNIYQNGAEFVEVSIKDDGPGIPREILQQLFAPVTSTKEGHSGVGLAIVSTLISELSGQISCCSNAGNGTEFKIYLPRTLAAAQME